MPKKILVLGGAGMLGHKVYQVFSRGFETKVTVRKLDQALLDRRIFDSNDVITNVDASSFDTIKETIANTRPDVVINCIGIIKQFRNAKNHKVSMR